ncbi:MAG TPA: LuxR C-terminal-related transcriptional regulator, partial [Symbiobacteriaceae bacterium]|nr:LuxR C-terminal-related transcriptional regulator [Symbiobacteriaceae bacterium]
TGPLSLAGPLTEREREILTLLARGCSNQEMAAALVVAIGTVKAHVHQILVKLEAPSRTAAVARARELGLLR